MKSSIIKQLIDRMGAESPRFFIILRWIFGILAVFASITKWVIVKELWVPDNAKILDAVQEVCGYILTSAGTMWFSSLLPVKDVIPETPKENLSEENKKGGQ